MINSNDKIHIFHHVYLTKHGLHIASQQLHLLSVSGLLDYTTQLNIGILYDDVKLKHYFLKLVKTYDTNNNITILFYERNKDSDERKTGLFVKRFADTSKGDEKILYIHTKGASRHETKHELSINYWRQYLEFFNIVNWKDCVDGLNKGYDTCGVLWTEGTWASINKSGKHYSGAFYWIKSQMVKRIPIEHFSESSKYGRYAMEAVPSLVDHKALSLHTLGSEFKNPYNDIIHPRLYVGVNDDRRIQTEIITATPLLAKPTALAKPTVVPPKVTMSISDFVQNSDNKKVIYTCIVNDYDVLQEPLFVNKEWDYICFSDKDIKSKHWKIVRIPNDCLDEKGSLVQRKLKVLPHEYLETYDISIWVDGNIQPKVNPNVVLDKYHKKNFNLMAHPFRTCVYDELTAIESHKKESVEKLNNVRQKYLREGYPKNNGLVQSGILIRKHNLDVVKTIGNSWWNLIKEHSHRDQLTFNYFLWKYPNLSKHVHLFGANSMKIEFNYYQHGSNKLVDLPKDYGSIRNFINGSCVYNGFYNKMKR